MNKYERAVYSYFNSGRKNTVCYRFQDSADANRKMAIYQRKTFTPGFILMGKNPSDLIVTENGETYYAEVKSTANTRGITSPLFETQRGDRKRILAAGGKYYYFIYSITLYSWYKVPAQIIAESASRSWLDLAKYKIGYIDKVY